MAEETNTGCPHDCRKCSFQQHSYCSVQLSYQNKMAVELMSERIAQLEDKIQSILGGGALVSPQPQIAQNESGAEE